MPSFVTVRLMSPWYLGAPGPSAPTVPIRPMAAYSPGFVYSRTAGFVYASNEIHCLPTWNKSPNANREPLEPLPEPQEFGRPTETWVVTSPVKTRDSRASG